jgi:carboxypeptidase Taq
MRVEEAYQELKTRSRRRAVLGSCAALLSWDEQTYMPRGGSEHRADQLALLAGLHHEQATDPRIGELIAQIDGTELVADPESAEAVNVREWRRDFERATKLPRELVEALARATSLGQQVWLTRKRRAISGVFAGRWKRS